LSHTFLKVGYCGFKSVYPLALVEFRDSSLRRFSLYNRNSFIFRSYTGCFSLGWRVNRWGQHAYSKGRRVIVGLTLRIRTEGIRTRIVREIGLKVGWLERYRFPGALKLRLSYSYIPLRRGGSSESRLLRLTPHRRFLLVALATPNPGVLVVCKILGITAMLESKL
jgi:hypothetical protein